MSTLQSGPGLSGIPRDGGERPATSVRRRDGTGRAPGSVLIGVAAAADRRRCAVRLVQRSVRLHL
jgi:hypothetical protein